MTAELDEVCLDRATVRYSRAVVGPVSLTFAPGITCLVGANGAGKSTIFRVLAGVQDPTDGTASVPRSRFAGKRSAVGYLPQDQSLPGAATCRQYLEYVAWISGIARRDRSAAVVEALEIADLAERRNSAVRELSGGMRRRLGLAQAIVHDPQVLLLDEPTVGLDPVQRIAMRKVITASSPRRVTVVSTHLVDDVEAMADRVVVLNAGSVVFDGDVDGLIAQTAGDGDRVRRLEDGLTRLMSRAVGA
ncbi:ABC transporter ATP-binding protein [Isoptericola croceus]|uniref:ABC transporter ATP-binding protein n=1 Tax=Isoptericola croceus TaxID=3031406 RepID=UPI0023F9D36A|nr:ATP-binding cassette domain-containing protein [Isoptericola croceus]